MISFGTSVCIERPVEQVFAFVCDPTQFPRWNSAVRAVQRISGETGQPGSTYSMERELPTGRVENGLEVFAGERPSVFGIRTTSGPTPFIYSYRFASDGAGTVVPAVVLCHRPRAPRPAPKGSDLGPSLGGSRDQRRCDPGLASEARQGPWKPEVAEGGGVGEPGDRSDRVALERQDNHSVRAGDSCLLVG